jgi:hypothetical protein
VAVADRPSETVDPIGPDDHGPVEPGDGGPVTGGRRDRSSTFAIVAIAALAVAAVIAVMWLLARAERDDAVAERDDARAGEAAARADARSMNDELQVANDGRTVAEAEVERLTGRVEDLTAGAESDAARIAELEDEVAALTAEVERLTDENQSLADRPEDPPETDASLDATAPPEFARYLGEVLSSRSGSSRLSAVQSTCFGTAVVEAIGLDAVGAGLHNARTSAANDALVAAMQQAVSTCGLDPALVFG